MHCVNTDLRKAEEIILISEKKIHCNAKHIVRNLGHYIITTIKKEKQEYIKDNFADQHATDSYTSCFVMMRYHELIMCLFHIYDRSFYFIMVL